MDTTRKPSWLRAKLPSGPGYQAVRSLVDEHKLHTVCQSAQCPNLGECWSRGTATVMILGNICTRSCNFCAIQTGRPTELDLGEPARVADAVAKMGLRHCVITSVARDELADGGAAVWAATIRAVRHRNPQTAIEVLTPDWKGKLHDLDTVLDAKPDIFNQPTDEACSIWSQDRFGTRDVCNQRETRQEEEAHNRAAYTTEQWNAACTVRGAHDHTCISNPVR